MKSYISLVDEIQNVNQQKDLHPICIIAVHIYAFGVKRSTGMHGFILKSSFSQKRIGPKIHTEQCDRQ